MTSFLDSKSLPSADGKLFGPKCLPSSRWQAFWLSVVVSYLKSIDSGFVFPAFLRHGPEGSLRSHFEAPEAFRRQLESLEGYEVTSKAKEAIPNLSPGKYRVGLCFSSFPATWPTRISSKSFRKGFRDHRSDFGRQEVISRAPK